MLIEDLVDRTTVQVDRLTMAPNEVIGEGPIVRRVVYRDGDRIGIGIGHDSSQCWPVDHCISYLTAERPGEHIEVMYHFTMEQARTILRGLQDLVGEKP